MPTVDALPHLTPMTSSAPAMLNDPQRLLELRRLLLLDTPREETFDGLTRLTAQVLGAPAALLTLVDVDRQFFKSSFGLPDPLATARQTPMRYSICQYAVASRETLIVEDLHAHPELRVHPAVREFGVAAYAGEPLIVGSGHAVGALCAIDFEPRP